MRCSWLRLGGFLLLPLLLACNATFTFNSGTIDGTVSQVRLSVIGGANGTSWQVTIVTLQTTDGTSQMTFCGNHASQFPRDQEVNVQFTPGTPCASNVVVRLRS